MWPTTLNLLVEGWNVKGMCPYIMCPLSHITSNCRECGPNAACAQLHTNPDDKPHCYARQQDIQIVIISILSYFL
jgi:hypothetical protein